MYVMFEIKENKFEFMGQVKILNIKLKYFKCKYL